jgi:hypothetical protein
MDLYDAAQYFDKLTATDAYSGATLFTCQMDQYDSTERDSVTGWRRTCSAPEIVVPARRAIKVNGKAYLVGRTQEDYFNEYVIREHALLHPSDGIFTLGSAKQFLSETHLLSYLHGAQSLLQQKKEEGESSQLFSFYSIYVGLNETATKDQIVQAPDGTYYRIQNVEIQTGQYKTLSATELGASALLQVSFISSSGGYDPVTDSSGAEAPILITAFFERYQTNYRYMTWASDRFRNGDRVLTVDQDDIPEPANNDRVQVNGSDYKVLSVHSDDMGGWEMHLRAADFNLTSGG